MADMNHTRDASRVTPNLEAIRLAQFQEIIIDSHLDGSRASENDQVTTLGRFRDGNMTTNRERTLQVYATVCCKPRPLQRRISLSHPHRDVVNRILIDPSISQMLRCTAATCWAGTRHIGCMSQTRRCT